MANQKFNLKSSEEVRTNITQQQQREIQKVYNELYQDVTKKVGSMGNNNIQKQNLILLQRDINKRVKQINADIENNIVRGMDTICKEVVSDKRTFLKQCGYKESEIHNAFRYVPSSVIENIKTGSIYQEGWTLSNAIWGYSKETQNTLNDIIAKDTALGKSALEVARDIERYVDPSAKKPSRVIKYINPKTGKHETYYFGRVDYNAQRLARTLFSHAYQQSFEQVNKKDPFVTGYRWMVSNAHGRVCEICLARDGVVFKKDELPLDHPNGMCTFEAVIPDSMDDIAKKIGEWYNNPDGAFPELDEYALSFLEGE